MKQQQLNLPAKDLNLAKRSERADPATKKVAPRIMPNHLRDVHLFHLQECKRKEYIPDPSRPDHPNHPFYFDFLERLLKLKTSSSSADASSKASSSSLSFLKNLSSMARFDSNSSLRERVQDTLAGIKRQGQAASGRGTVLCCYFLLITVDIHNEWIDKSNEAVDLLDEMNSRAGEVIPGILVPHSQ